jgi:UDP-GlcNAc:undecaprenyl-phosphate/decaprenyl-phosphate GlcNAc-1-phosphate transferase
LKIRIVYKQIPNQKLLGVFHILFPFSISYLLTPLICRLAEKLRILDIPDKRKVHHIATPLLGGVVIYLAFAIGTVTTQWYSVEFKTIVYAATLIFILGLMDDIMKLSSVLRLTIQVLAVFILFTQGMEINFLPDFTRLRILDKLITILWIVGITNAVNFLDGLDGLCVGFGVIASLFFGAIAFLTGQYFFMFLAFSLAGSCLGFLPWNFRLNKPARIFMGDAGSLFIGFTLASFAIMGEWAENKTVALFVPVLILLLPIFDISMITFFRIKDGAVKTVREWFDYVGKDHFHHRLYDFGISKKKVVWIMYLLTALLGFSAVIIRTSGTMEAYLELLQAITLLIIFISFIVIARKRCDIIVKESKKMSIAPDENDPQNSERQS